MRSPITVHASNNQMLIHLANTSCYKVWRTSYPTFFPQRYLPAIVLNATSENRLKSDQVKGSFRSLFHSLFSDLSPKLDICCNEYCSSLQ